MVDDNTKEILSNIQTEISAGKVLIPRSDAEHAHNNASDRAISIVQNYKEDIGLSRTTRRRQLFQMTARARQRTANAKPNEE